MLGVRDRFTWGRLETVGSVRSTRQRSQFLDYGVRSGQQHRVTSGRVTLTQFFLHKFKHVFESPVNSWLALLDTTHAVTTKHIQAMNMQSPPNTYKPWAVITKHIQAMNSHQQTHTSHEKSPPNTYKPWSHHQTHTSHEQSPANTYKPWAVTSKHIQAMSSHQQRHTSHVPSATSTSQYLHFMSLPSHPPQRNGRTTYTVCIQLKREKSLTSPPNGWITLTIHNLAFFSSFFLLHFFFFFFNFFLELMPWRGGRWRWWQMTTMMMIILERGKRLPCCSKSVIKSRSTHSRTQYTLTHYTFRSFETNTRRNTRYWYYSGTVLLTLQVFVVLWNSFIDRIGLRNRHRNRTQTVKS